MKFDDGFIHVETEIKEKISIDSLNLTHNEFDKRCFSFTADNQNLPFKD